MHLEFYKKNSCFFSPNFPKLDLLKNNSPKSLRIVKYKIICFRGSWRVKTSFEDIRILFMKFCLAKQQTKRKLNFLTYNKNEPLTIIIIITLDRPDNLFKNRIHAAWRHLATFPTSLRRGPEDGNPGLRWSRNSRKEETETTQSGLDHCSQSRCPAVRHAGTWLFDWL